MKPSIAIDALMVLFGKESPERFIATLIVIALGDALFSMEVLKMDALIIIPEGMFIWTVLVLTISAIVGPVFSALYMKDESAHADDQWKTKYLATMFLDFFVTPLGGLMVMSYIIQKFNPTMNGMFYEVMLFFVCIAVSYVALMLMNKGITATVNQIKKLFGEADAAISSITRNKE